MYIYVHLDKYLGLTIRFIKYLCIYVLQERSYKAIDLCKYSLQLVRI